MPRRWQRKPAGFFPIASHIPFEHALAEPIACATNGVLRANIQLGDTVALVGTGFMELLLLQQVALQGASAIIAIDPRQEMLELAQRFGANVAINPQKENAVQRVKELTDGAGVDAAFEAGGVQATLDLAAGLARMEASS